MSRARIDGLNRVAQFIFEKEQSKLSSFQTLSDRMHKEKKEFLEQAEIEAQTVLSDINYQRNVLRHRKIWLDSEIYTRAHHEARAKADVEIQRKVAQRAFGRLNVLKNLL